LTIGKIEIGIKKGSLLPTMAITSIPSKSWARRIAETVGSNQEKKQKTHENPKPKNRRK
jgi:hypothetical protein